MIFFQVLLLFKIKESYICDSKITMMLQNNVQTISWWWQLSNSQPE